MRTSFLLSTLDRTGNSGTRRESVPIINSLTSDTPATGREIPAPAPFVRDNPIYDTRAGAGKRRPSKESYSEVPAPVRENAGESIKEGKTMQNQSPLQQAQSDGIRAAQGIASVSTDKQEQLAQMAAAFQAGVIVGMSTAAAGSNE